MNQRVFAELKINKGRNIRKPERPFYKRCIQTCITSIPIQDPEIMTFKGQYGGQRYSGA
jgi:hypothetical protein